MQTQCNADRIDSSHHGRREVTGASGGGRLSSDGGAPLPVEADPTMSTKKFWTT